jgi:hypothetical protein
MAAENGIRVELCPQSGLRRCMPERYLAGLFEFFFGDLGKIGWVENIAPGIAGDSLFLCKSVDNQT